MTISGAVRPAIGPAIFLIVLGYALLSAGDTVVKWVSGAIPLPEIIFFNAIFGLVPVLGMAARAQGGLRSLATRRMHLHLLRGAFSVGGYFFGYYALGHMHLADFYAVAFTAPLFVTTLSAPVLGERVDGARWAAVVIGFAGVVIMVRPGGGVEGEALLGAAAILVGALLFAFQLLLARRMGGTETASAVCFYSFVITASATAVPMVADFIPPDRVAWECFTLCGLFNGFGLLCIVAAFRRAPAAVLAPFHYTQMIWGVLVGLLLFGEWPGPALAAGGSLVVGSGLFILFRETRMPRVA